MALEIRTLMLVFSLVNEELIIFWLVFRQLTAGLRQGRLWTFNSDEGSKFEARWVLILSTKLISTPFLRITHTHTQIIFQVKNRSVAPVHLVFFPFLARNYSWKAHGPMWTTPLYTHKFYSLRVPPMVWFLVPKIKKSPLDWRM